MPPPGLQIYLRRRVTLTLELLTLKVNHFIRLVTDDSCMSEEEVRPQCHGSRGRLTKICIAWLAFQWYEKTFLRLKYFSSSSTMCSKWTNLHSLVVTTLDCQPVSFKPLYLVSHYPRPPNRKSYTSWTLWKWPYLDLDLWPWHANSEIFLQSM